MIFLFETLLAFVQRLNAEIVSSEISFQRKRRRNRLSQDEIQGKQAS